MLIRDTRDPPKFIDPFDPGPFVAELLNFEEACFAVCQR